MYVCIFAFFEAKSYALLAGLELTMQTKLSDHRAPLLPLECWDYRREPPPFPFNLDNASVAHFRSFLP